MGLTLLIDLDNTLLGNDMETFLPAYLQNLGRCFIQYAEPEKMLKALLNATQKMIENNQPTQTLKEVFDTHFYPALNLSYETPQETLTQFYEYEFPKLRSLTQTRPEALALIQYGLQQGFQIAVATNPLFPSTAIHQRLEWAGLSPTEAPFAHITTYENAHFAKPNPAYYAEILTYLGWPEQPILMVGDDWERDIFPAQQLGLSSFWVNDAGGQNKTPSPTSAGPLSALVPWLRQADLNGLLPSYNSSVAIQATLRAIPAVLKTQFATLPPSIWHAKATPEAWNLTETVCHMRDVEIQVNLPRLKQILQEENPFIAGVDTDAWIETYQYALQDGLSAFHDFLACRLQTLSLLEQLSDADWRRPARHAIFGPTSFQEIAHFIAEHDRLHIRQIYPLIFSK
ncbi:MAG: hypothetical protein Fur0022_46260 [Anaerolineales bacterium]